MTTRVGRIALLAAGTVLLAGAAFAFRAPRITLLNAALRIDHPWSAGAGALAAAAGCALWAGAVSRRLVRLPAVAMGLGLTVLGVGRLTYRLDVEDRALASREWTGTTAIPWGQVSRVESGPARVVVWGAGDEQVRIETGGFEPAQRATLDRAIARLVREGSRPRTAAGSAPARP